MMASAMRDSVMFAPSVLDFICYVRVISIGFECYMAVISVGFETNSYLRKICQLHCEVLDQH